METIQNTVSDIVENVKETATPILHQTADFLGIPHEMTEEEARRELEIKGVIPPGYDPDWHSYEVDPVKIQIDQIKKGDTRPVYIETETKTAVVDPKIPTSSK
jgi:hypothetical protein